MASAPQASLPLFYNDLVPLNLRDHATWHARAAQTATWMVGQHAVPLTVEEFLAWQRAIDRFGLAGLRATRVQQYRN